MASWLIYNSFVGRICQKTCLGELILIFAVNVAYKDIISDWYFNDYIPNANCSCGVWGYLQKMLGNCIAKECLFHDLKKNQAGRGCIH